MKKFLIVLAIVAALALGGCTVAEEEIASIGETELGIEPGSPDIAPVGEDGGSDASVSSPLDSMKLSLQEAEDIALAHAGVSYGDAEFSAAAVGFSDGRTCYTIHFTAGGMRYHYWVDGMDGEIVDYSSRELTEEDSGDTTAAYTPAVGQDGTVYLPETEVTIPPAAPSVDASSAPDPQPESNSEKISLERAKELALAYAEKDAASMTFTKELLTREDGREVYDLEFYFESDLYFESYDVEVDAYSGLITDFDKDVEKRQPAGEPSGKDEIGSTPAPISEADAKKIALDHADPVAAGTITYTKVELEYDDDRGVNGWNQSTDGWHGWVYEIEFYTYTDALYYEYDYTIDAMDGEIYESSVEEIYRIRNEVAQPTATPSADPTASPDMISEQRAKEIALAQVPGATAANIREFKLDRDDGKVEYEGEIVYGGYEYEFEIDAYSGAIRDWDAEPVDD